MMFNFNKGYDFSKEKYYFTINNKRISAYGLDDIEKFIVENRNLDVVNIKLKLQDQYNLNNVNSYFLIWNKIHKLYIEDIIVWKGKNPFEDMYEYKGKNFSFKIDVSLNKNYDEYKKGIFNLFAKDESQYEKNINNIIYKPLKNLIYFSIYKDNKIVGMMIFLLGVKKNSYIIGSVDIDKHIDCEILDNALLWAGSRLCLIFGQICKTFEFRIDKKDIDTPEVRQLIDFGFKVSSDRKLGVDCFLLEKDI